MSLEYPFLNTIGVASINGVNPFLLIQLSKLGQQLGRPIDVFSGYRSPGYSERVGGYANDPHSRGEAVDAQIGGTPIGMVVPVATLAALGLEGGNTPGFYPRGGNGGRDPEHVQIPGSGVNKGMRSPTLHLATGNPASGNVPPSSIATQIPNATPGTQVASEIPNATDPGLAGRIDQFLRGKGSPLAGQGATFVAAGARNGIDPRLLVAISGGESSFGLHNFRPYNAWGYMAGDFHSYPEAINTIAADLGRNYIGAGKTSISDIGAKWAPVGASNDPTNLNRNWVSTISQFYRELGGDPQSPVTATSSPRVTATAASGATGAGTSPGPPPPAQPVYVPPPPPALSPLPPVADTPPIVLLPAPPAKTAVTPTTTRQGAPPPYDPANDRALAPAEPTGPLRRLYPVAKLEAAPTAGGGSGGPLRRLFPVSKLGRG